MRAAAARAPRRAAGGGACRLAPCRVSAGPAQTGRHLPWAALPCCAGCRPRAAAGQKCRAPTVPLRTRCAQCRGRSWLGCRGREPWGCCCTSAAARRRRSSRRWAAGQRSWWSGSPGAPQASPPRATPAPRRSCGRGCCHRAAPACRLGRWRAAGAPAPRCRAPPWPPRRRCLGGPVVPPCSHGAGQS